MAAKPFVLPGDLIPGREQSYHWGYYSCNGFTPDVPREEGEKKWCGLEPLWRDVLARHKDLPLHVMVGAGRRAWPEALPASVDIASSPCLLHVHRTGGTCKGQAHT
jgi:hypothetical protein